jgi:phage terminase large subunit-like protein
VAALYEQGKVRHLGAFPILEDQMCGFTREPGSWSGAGFDRLAAGASPDRVDALVWALSDLLIQAMPKRRHLRAVPAICREPAGCWPRRLT